MIKFFIRPGILIIFTISVMHVIWGSMLVEGPLETVGLALIAKLCGSNFGAGIALMASGAIAMVSVFVTFKIAAINVMMFFPQQFVLAVSATSAIECVYTGQYADGVIHPSVFIFSDQLWCILLFISHGMAIALSQIWIRHINFISFS